MFNFVKFNYQYFYKKMKKLLFFSSILFFAIFIGSKSAPISNYPYQISQPNGDKIECFVSGDEFFNFLHDSDGRLIIQNSDGFYYYAKKVDGKIVPTEFNASYKAPASIEKWIKPDEKEMESRRNKFFQAEQKAKQKKLKKAPLSGVINNLVVFIRFADQDEYKENISFFDSLYNGRTVPSLYSYYQEVSYKKLKVFSHFYPNSSSKVLSFQDEHPRNYYMPYNATTNPIGYEDSNTTMRELSLIAKAMESIKSQITDPSSFDKDNDFYFDNVTYVIQGASSSWSSLLWPHRSWFFGYYEIGGIGIRDYNFIMSDFYYSRGVGVVAHEFFHSLGAPDYYHYNQDAFSPVGKWDIMCQDVNPPQHMSAYSKYTFASWLNDIPMITSSGTYSLKPLTSETNNCYKIYSPNSDNEYFVLEYRKKEGMFESSLPGSGLLVYKINSDYYKQGNASGPPDEVYLYRLNGTRLSNGNPDNANLNAESGRRAINDYSNPKTFFEYGGLTGLDIYDVSACNETISFKVNFEPRPFIITPRNAANRISVRPTITWNNVEGAQNYIFQLAQDSLFTNIETNQVGISDTSFVSPIALKNNTTYFVRVRCVYSGSSDKSIWSIPVKFTVMLETPKLIEPINKIDSVEKLATFKWKSVDGAISYTLNVSEDSVFTKVYYTKLSLVDTIFKIDKALKAKTKYYWRITALSLNNGSAISPVFSFTSKYNGAGITAQPQSQTICANSPYTLRLEAYGEKNKYEWYKDSVLLNNIKDTLLINFPFFSDSDTGSYYCKITNSSMPEPIVSNSVHLSMIGKILIVSQSKKINIIDAGNIEIEAEAFSANMPSTDNFTYQWFKNSTSLIDNTNIQGVRTKKLTIINPQASDADSNYKLRITNKCKDTAYAYFSILGVNDNLATSEDKGISIEIAPNPCDENAKIIINSEYDHIANLKLFSSTGTLINEIPNYNIHSGKMELNLSDLIENLNSGVYNLILQTDNKIFVKKFAIFK